MIKKSTINKNGFAVLFAILIASFLITLGISIFTISLKEIQIVTSARDSQIAYYAADSARECALYWDVKQGAFPACLNNDCSWNTEEEASKIVPVCNGKEYTDLTLTRVSNTLTYSLEKYVDFFQFSLDSSSTPIADISIYKTYNPDTKNIVTTIKAYGHNTSILGRRVERGIQTTNNN